MTAPSVILYIGNVLVTGHKDSTNARLNMTQMEVVKMLAQSADASDALVRQQRALGQDQRPDPWHAANDVVDRPIR